MTGIPRQDMLQVHLFEVRRAIERLAQMNTAGALLAYAMQPMQTRLVLVAVRRPMGSNHLGAIRTRPATRVPAYGAASQQSIDWPLVTSIHAPWARQLFIPAPYVDMDEGRQATETWEELLRDVVGDVDPQLTSRRKDIARGLNNIGQPVVPVTVHNLRSKSGMEIRHARIAD